MTMNLSAIPGIEDLKEANVGFRFLTKKGPNDSGAMMLFQWCLAPQFLAFLKGNEVLDAKVFVVVKNPRGREMRYIFNLSSPQELIEFHCSGEHKVTGIVVWGGEIKRSCRRFLLQTYDRGQYDNDLNYCYSYSTSFGLAELSVNVEDGFFAPEMSPLQDWWVNLWFDGQTWDECMIRRRKMVAYTIQPIAVAIFALFLFIVRTIYAFWAGVLLLRKNVPWEAVVRPFQHETADIWNDSRQRWELEDPMNLLLPIAIMILTVILFAVGAGLYQVAHFLGSHGLSWEMFFGGIVGCLAIWWATRVFPRLSRKVKSLREPAPETPHGGLERGVINAMHMWDEWYKNRAKKVRAERLERIYSDLSCATAPASGATRARRSGFTQNAVLVYHDIKTRVCRPTARR